MVIDNRTRRRYEQALRELLQYTTIDELLEEFDIEPEEAVLALYEGGQLDPQKFEDMFD